MTAFQVKVCGMRDPANIAQLSALPIDYMGFIFYPKSARFITSLPDLSALPASIRKVGVFVDATADDIRTKIAEGLDAVQLHGHESASFCEEIKQEGVILIKAFGIDQHFDWQSLSDYLHVVDYFLFDTKSDSHGGTGQKFDWENLATYPFAKPYLLSGGLSLDNVAEAVTIKDPRLLGFDLNSRFETAPALKDINRLTQALKIIKT